MKLRVNLYYLAWLHFVVSSEEGKLTLDSDTLDTLLVSDFDKVGELFAASNGLAKYT